MSFDFRNKAFVRRFALFGIGAAAATAALCAGSLRAEAAPWPSKTITIVSPYPAGGITDALCRIVAQQLSKVLGQHVIVQDRPGAGGAIAMMSVAKAAPDGYTLIMGGSAPSTILPAVHPTVGYNPIKDFTPVAYVAALPMVLVANPQVPAKNLKDFLAYAQANGGKMNCASDGVGTGSYLACLQFAKQVNPKIAAIPYAGGPQANLDLLANRAQFYFAPLPVEIGYIRTGKVRAYGMASAARLPSVPNIPTLAEEGLKGFNLDAWNALYAPAGTPKAITERLNKEINKILGMPDVRKKIEATGSVEHIASASALGQLTATQYQHYKQLASEAHIKLH